ncbi:MAG: hypothetical protein LBM96_02115 [Methanobrevibacter sp.]|nr:hypothetical protein [Candidatus Methanoflexus mossambicus]
MLIFNFGADFTFLFLNLLDGSENPQDFINMTNLLNNSIYVDNFINLAIANSVNS